MQIRKQQLELDMEQQTETIALTIQTFVGKVMLALKGRMDSNARLLNLRTRSLLCAVFPPHKVHEGWLGAAVSLNPRP